MTGEGMGEWIVHGLISLIWVGVLLTLAGVAFMRFRTTLSGILLTSGFALWAAKLAVFFVAGALMPRLFEDPLPYFVAQSATSTLFSILILNAIGAGVAVIPKSLQKLSQG